MRDHDTHVSHRVDPPTTLTPVPIHRDRCLPWPGGNGRWDASPGSFSRTDRPGEVDTRRRVSIRVDLDRHGHVAMACLVDWHGDMQQQTATQPTKHVTGDRIRRTSKLLRCSACLACGHGGSPPSSCVDEWHMHMSRLVPRVPWMLGATSSTTSDCHTAVGIKPPIGWRLLCRMGSCLRLHSPWLVGM